MTCFPISTDAIEHYADAREQFEQLLGRLMHEETQALRHGEVENLVQKEGEKLLRRMLQGYFDQRSAEEQVRECVVGEDGRTRAHRREGCERDLETRFGQVIVSRRSYGARGLDSVFPLAAP